MASTNFDQCPFVGILCIAYFLAQVLKSLFGHAFADVKPAEVPTGTTLLNVGLCSKFADCNEYCQENCNHILGGFCKEISTGGEKFCLCEV
ncbi:putative defensin-like protein 30 [Argentina anserina]|uniref:putative defensin-like protein 30 n=1 Tax=Argentina anserina TaxID=57926 RepID=UPI00217688C3|nr:putative defensin-like protein 30 [Potentilla anserina]